MQCKKHLTNVTERIRESGGRVSAEAVRGHHSKARAKTKRRSQIGQYLGLGIHLRSRTAKPIALQPNHLLGYQRTVIQLVFRNVNDLFLVRKEVLPVVQRNQAKMDAVDAYAEVVSRDHGMDTDFVDESGDATSAALPDYVAQASNVASTSSSAATEYLIDIREYDVPYCLRVAIDKGER